MTLGNLRTLVGSWESHTEIPAVEMNPDISSVHYKSHENIPMSIATFISDA